MMITKFENYKLITENPDKISFTDKDDDEDAYRWSDNGTKPFYIIVNENHTKAKRLYVGDYGDTHSNIRIKLDRDDNKEQIVSYPGRLWLNEKIITFWVYPNVTLFIDIIKKLEKRLRRKIFNNGWRIEVIKNNDEIETKDFDSDEDNEEYYGSNYVSGKLSIIPLDDYAGSKNPPKEERIMHMMNWKEKQLAKKRGELDIKGWGSDKTAWDSPHNIQWRQAIYQEKKNNDDN